MPSTLAALQTERYVLFSSMLASSRRSQPRHVGYQRPGGMLHGERRRRAAKHHQGGSCGATGGLHLKGLKILHECQSNAVTPTLHSAGIAAACGRSNGVHAACRAWYRAIHLQHELAMQALHLHGLLLLRWQAHYLKHLQRTMRT